MLTAYPMNMPLNMAIANAHSLSQAISLALDSFTSTIMITQPAMVAIAGALVKVREPSAVKKLPEARLANAPSMAPAEMMGTILALPFDIKWLTLSILSQNRKVKISQPSEPHTMVHTPQANAMVSMV